MTEAHLMAEWRTGCAKHGLNIETNPTPAAWHDLAEEFRYELGSFVEQMSDKEIADNVRATLWLADIGHRWEHANG